MTARPKVALVTGGTRGIGRAISLVLAGEGMRLLAPYARNRRAAEALEEEARERGLAIAGLRGDLSREEPFRRTVAAIRERAETVDVLVHATATGVHRPAQELTPKHLRFTFETNVVAAHALIRELLPRIPAGGRIVGLTSVGGRRALPTYGRGGRQQGWPRGPASPLGGGAGAPRHRRQPGVPGTVRTRALDAMPDTEARIADAERRTPSGRLTTCEEVAAVVVFLCGTAAQIVGQTIVIDGGKTLPG